MRRRSAPGAKPPSRAKSRKKFETVYRGTLAELALRAASDADMARGEIVIVVHGARGAASSGEGCAAAEGVLRVLLEELPVSQAAKLAARITGRGRNELYELALRAAPKLPQRVTRARYNARGSRPGNRCANLQRKVRAPQGKVPGNAWGARAHGKCNRKQTAEALQQCGDGKGERVR